ncbi:non-specific lipid transfer protein GPI-anchored 2 [Senna tora]|uniref:Non-specific lipid transfer protein GPI-anchored 2 n=1 Tax=Senna tora TaxID=362788 RepID=A0A834SM18_9FABA|nr:non-specific lipid transfer protein GPI-anchored 2 [Senna tora]
MATAVHPLLTFSFAWTLLFANAAAAAAPPPSPPETPSCTDELVLFSPCLPFVSSPPNNLDDAASANCCDSFSSAADSGAAVCLCYLLREPPILGFPLNSTRLLSLPSVCLPANRASTMAQSLNSLCSESSVLPPLNKSATLGFTNHSTTESRNKASPLLIIPPRRGGGGGARGARGRASSDSGSDRSGSSGGGSVVGMSYGHHSSESEGICSIGRGTNGFSPIQELKPCPS